MICHRCGKCCYRGDTKCRFLIVYPNGRTCCRIYKARQKEGFRPLLVDPGWLCVPVGQFGTKCLYPCNKDTPDKS